ncbi:trehalose-6-phosphate synthase [Ascidiimonas sp. W6]|uniref:trehalose-6-phosphate synthase n=1 Tax=Ascidiimonas meishanensis TaxID=3128903 RepID=UPI0030EC941D
MKTRGDSNAENQDTEPKKPVYIVSFSLPVGVKIEEDQVKLESRAGGLGVAVNAGLTEDSPYELKSWIGLRENYLTEDGQVDTATQEKVNNAFTEGETHNFKYAYVSQEVRDALYANAANQLIYPTLLQLDDKIDPQATLDGYEAGNKALANEVINTIKQENDGEVPKDTMIWVHDYQILSVPKYLKEEAPEAKVGFFMHTPFPEIKPENLLLTEQDNFKIALENVIAADSIQFHTEEFKADFLKTLQNFEIVETPEQLAEIEAKIEVNPIGIPTEMIEEMSNTRFDEILAGIPENEDKENVLFEALEQKMQEWTTDEKGNQKEGVKGSLKIDPKMVNMGSVGRYDYTKAQLDQLKAFQMLLNMAKSSGIEKPEELYRMHVVAAPARNIKEDLQYAAKVVDVIEDILKEFPDAVNLIPGVQNAQLPIFNAAMDIHVAPSKADGYLISAGEAFVSRNVAEKRGLLNTNTNKSALVLTTNAGMARTLEKYNIPSVSIVKPEAVNIANALAEQSIAILNERGTAQATLDRRFPLVTKKEEEKDKKIKPSRESLPRNAKKKARPKNSQPKDTQRGFTALPSLVNTNKEFTLKALAALSPENAERARSISRVAKRPAKRSQSEDKSNKKARPSFS